MKDWQIPLDLANSISAEVIWQKNHATMSSQYDDIGATYEGMRKLPIAVLQDANVEAAVAPFIKGARILDLACGMGYYSRKFLVWGAKQVVGVDVSQGMVDAANATSTNLDGLSFQIVDCSVPTRYEQGPFDVVFGTWLLNYAAGGKDMANLFRNASLNLKDSGHFIGVTPPPTDDPREHSERALAARPAPYGGVVVTITKDVDEGVAPRLDALMKTGKVELDAYHLTKSVYESSAREGRLKGALTWRPVDSPDIRSEELESPAAPLWRII